MGRTGLAELDWATGIRSGPNGPLEFELGRMRAGPLLDWTGLLVGLLGTRRRERNWRKREPGSLAVGGATTSTRSCRCSRARGFEGPRAVSSAKKKGGFRALGVRTVKAEGEWESELRSVRTS
ncbi:hypothetical protein CRG98_019573 [Punica granatum]|uniref:Uncharacterized protein n=1 Tax=Punica granatum TaxID=22663 RepID=A0A2I0JUP4_PUNGR|nr:hypothetical protein CRG98_019573 [Punica granatum]